MQLNFNQPKVNFKASFDNNIFTKGIAKSMAYHNPETILAAELALKDVASEEKISLTARSDDLKKIIYTAKGQTEITLGSPIESAAKLLISICDGTLLGIKPRAKKGDYIRLAKSLIKDIKAKNTSEQREISLKLARLKQEANRLRSELSNLKKENQNKILQTIEKHMFEVAKTIK